jgi:6-phosphogluconolactonase
MSSPLIPTAQGETCLYVSDGGTKTIVHFDLDPTTGKLQEVSRNDVGIAPGPIAVYPATKHLYASLRTTASVGSFQIEPGGQLKKLNQIQLAAGANATYLKLTKSGRFALTASYSGAKVTVLRVGQDGLLANEPVQTIDTVKTAHATVLSPDERWLFVPHVEPNQIYQFRFDAESGKLTPQEPATGGAPGAGPRHLAFHPSHKFAFSSNESGSSVTLYAYDPEKGLSPLQTLSTLPTDFSGKNTTADVHVHPSGQFVWVSNRGHDSLAGFRFDEKTKTLTALGQTPTEKTPRSFALSPDGKTLFAGGEGTGKLAAYSVDAKSGKLERTGTYDVGTGVTWVEVVELR